MQQPILARKPQDLYRRQSTLTASPIELIVMLYDGLRRNLLLAERNIQKSDTQASHNNLIKAQDIVGELLNSLELSIPISNDLMRIYEYMLSCIEDINMSKDASLIPPLLEIVDTLRKTWQEVAESQKGSRISSGDEAAE